MMIKRTGIVSASDPFPDVFGTLAEQYHQSTRNPVISRGFSKGHEAHYSPYVQQLATEAPLHRKSDARVTLTRRGTVEMPLETAILHRRSGRNYGAAPLPAEQLASLLYLSNGVREVVAAGSQFTFYQRNVTNSGNLGSVEIFPIVLNVDGVEPGIYHFDTVHHDLACLHRGQFRSWLKERVFFQLEFSHAAAALILVSAVGRLHAKYGPKGYRLALIDVGHVSENIYLVGTGLGLQVCATAGFVDEELERALAIDGLDTAPMLMLLVGTPESALETSKK